jgi:hypothetical protein
MRTVNRLNRIGGGGATPSLASRITALLGPDASFWLPGPEWFFTDAAKTVPCTDTDLIRVWADGSANGRDLTQDTSAARPTARLIGGKWRAVFDGVDDCLFGVGFPTAVSDAYLALGLTRSANDQATFVMTDDANDDVTYVPFVDGNLYVAFGSTTRRDAITPVPAWATGTGRLLEVRGTATEHTIWLGGTQLFTTATTTRNTWRATAILGCGDPGAFSAVDIAFWVYARSIVDNATRSQLSALLTPLVP